MSGINFHGCETVGDIERKHSSAVIGKMLIETDTSVLKWRDGIPYSDFKKMLIFGVYATGDTIVFETEAKVGERRINVFSSMLQVVTDVYHAGDINWSPDDFQRTEYSIDDLSDEEFNFNGLLSQSTELPRQQNHLEYSPLTV